MDDRGMRKFKAVFVLAVVLALVSCTWPAADPSDQRVEDRLTPEEPVDEPAENATADDCSPEDHASVANEELPALEIEMEVWPERIARGEYAIVRLGDVPSEGETRVRFAGTWWDTHCWEDEARIVVVPASYHMEPGMHLVEARTRGLDQKGVAYAWVHVLEGEFETQHLTVDAELRSKRSPDLWREDRVHFARARGTTHPIPLWEHGAFYTPLEGRLTSSFGLLRYINEEPAGRHSGIDIAAPQGTPIVAAADGVVSLAMSLHVTGETIVIDHGLNLFGCYYHLSELWVEEGDTIRAGETIGLVGSTGFSTGPHLHYTASIGDIPVDPQLWFDGDPLRFLP